jgi:hypothetical protein
MRRAATALYLASLAAYVTSFALPAFHIVVEGRAKSDYGYSAFLLSLFAFWQPMFGGAEAFLIWLANAAFWAGVVFFACGRDRRALVASCVAVLLACRFVFAPLILVGYYVWLAGMALLLGACAVRLLHAWQASRPNQPLQQTGPPPMVSGVIRSARRPGC